MTILFSDNIICPREIRPKNLSILGRRKIQSESIIGSSSGKFFDRGNRVFEISFDVERMHKNPSEAQNFGLGHLCFVHALSPADLQIHSDFVGKTAPLKIRFAEASLSKVSCQIDADKTTFHYEFYASESEEMQ